MARIRTLKPEFWTDEKLAVLDPLTRLVFLGLISNADDHGRLIDNVKMLDGQIFPFTDDSCRESLEVLSRLSRVLRYRSKSGQSLIQLVGWATHQKVNHPGREILPAPTKDDFAQTVVAQEVATPPRTVRKRTAREPQENREQSSRTIPSDLVTKLPSDLTTTDSGESGERAISGSKPEPNAAPVPVPRFPPDLCQRLQAVAMISGHVTDFGRFRKALLLLYPASGPLYPEPELAEGLRAFYEAADGMAPREAQFQTIERFVQNVGRWVQLGTMPLANENGVTERGRLAAGVR